MKTILAADIDIVRQEGDTSKLEIEIPELITLPGRSIHFEVFDKAGNTIFKKTTWNVSGQQIDCEILESDTKGKAGNHRHEMEIFDSNVVYTIMRGSFDIIPERIKPTRHA